MTIKVREKYRELNVDFKNFSQEEFQKLVKAIEYGKNTGTPFASQVLNKIFEIVKWNGLYYDSDRAAKGLEPAKVTEKDAGEIMALSASAFKALMDDKNIYISRYSFPVVLESVSKKGGAAR
jgi:hypothetical protein